MAGWAFKLGSQGLGYYKEGANHHVVSPAAVIPKPVPVTLNLDGLIQHQKQPKQQGDTEQLGDPLKATMAEEADKQLKAIARKLKKQKARSALGVSSLRCVMAEQVVTKDISHRAKGLWAIDTASPNAWAGAEEYLSSTGADVATFQETKIVHEATADKEATARNMGWTTSLRPCVTGPGGGNSSGVAVACKKHIGMQHSCDDDMYPASCQGRLLVRKVGAICRGGYHQATA